jgi:competence protein ComGC
MATVINNPNDGGGAGVIVGAVVVIIILAVLFIYGIPAIRGNNTTITNSTSTTSNTDVNLGLPAATSGVDTGGTAGTGTGK